MNCILFDKLCIFLQFHFEIENLVVPVYLFCFFSISFFFLNCRSAFEIVDPVFDLWKYHTN